MKPASAIATTAFPLDEYYCRMVLQAPLTLFIGILVDVPYTKDQARLASFTNIEKLADGKGLGIDWTSPNLNNNWFAGSRVIPANETCHGSAWRKVIIAGLQQAAVAACGA